MANDLFRLEAQLAEQVAKQQREEELNSPERLIANKIAVGDSSSSLENGVSHSSSSEYSNAQPLGAQPQPRSSDPFEVIAPPGKLGILLSTIPPGNRNGPTHISQVRSTSVLAGKVHVGDMFVAIDDNEDVIHMNSKEITQLMGSKSEFERVLRFKPLISSSAMDRNEWI